MFKVIQAKKAIGRGTYDHLSQRGSHRNEHFLSRSRLQIASTHSAVAWLSDVVTHVPESDSDSGRRLPCGRTRPSRVRLLGYSGSHTLLLHVREPRKVIGSFVETVGLERFAVYVFDYGAPVGF